MMGTEAALSWKIVKQAAADLQLHSIMKRLMQSLTSSLKLYICRLNEMTQKLYLKEMLAGKRFFSALLLMNIILLPMSFAQKKVPVLERTISLKVSNEPLQSVLEIISQKTGCTFSYNPEAIPVKKTVSINAVNKTVREVLDQFNGELNYKAKGDYIILTKSTAQKTSEPSWFMISGYVTNGNNGEKIPDVSVYDKENKASSVTNNYGYYEIKVDKKVNSVQLIVNKQLFRDTLIYVRQSGSAIVNVTIYPEPAALTPVDSTAIKEQQMKDDQLAFINFILSEEQKVNTANIKDTMYKKVQVSFLPFIGTEAKLSGNTVSDYSFNILSGYTMGTRKFELGGLLNIDRDSVKSVQIAGLMNAVGGHVSGLQMGGLFNANMRTTSGAQIAGLINIDGDNVKGMQLGGLLNINLKSFEGLSGAGLVNTNLKKGDGVQLAGLVNLCVDTMKGVQIAGLVNVAPKVVLGSQIAGLINVGVKVKGSQLGFLNISDTLSGVPLGFLSFSYRGYHPIELSADEIFPVNLSWRTGVRSFYNIFSAGMQFDDISFPLWHFGYGVGTSARLGRTWWLNFDLTTQQIVKGDSFEEMNLLSKFHLTVDKSITKHFAIALGPVFNFYTSNTTVPYYETVYDKLPPYTFRDESYDNDLNIKTWLGGKFAIRVL